MNFNEENVNNSIDDQKKTNIIINHLNKNIQKNLQNNISDKNEIDKIKQNMKLTNNKNINTFLNKKM